MGVVNKTFWSIELNDLWSKKICRPKMIVGSGATFILRWSCFHTLILLLILFHFYVVGAFKKQKVYFSVLRGYYAEFKQFVKDVHFKSAQFHNLVNFLLDQGLNEEKKRLKDSVSRQRDMPSALSIVNGRRWSKRLQVHSIAVAFSRKTWSGVENSNSKQRTTWMDFCNAVPSLLTLFWDDQHREPTMVNSKII